MPDSPDTITVCVNVEITPEALQDIVANAKKIAGPDEKGVYRIDTADKVAEMISKFLREKNFGAFVKDLNRYR